MLVILSTEKCTWGNAIYAVFFEEAHRHPWVKTPCCRHLRSLVTQDKSVPDYVMVAQNCLGHPSNGTDTCLQSCFFLKPTTVTCEHTSDLCKSQHRKTKWLGYGPSLVFIFLLSICKAEVLLILHSPSLSFPSLCQIFNEHFFNLTELWSRNTNVNKIQLLSQRKPQFQKIMHPMFITLLFTIARTWKQPKWYVICGTYL